jgi:peptidyl-prolyl cis-trans isomerase SurA
MPRAPFASAVLVAVAGITPAVVRAENAPAPAAAAPADDVVVVDRIAAVVNKNVVLLSEVNQMLEQMNQAEPIPPGVDVDKAMTARKEEILDGLIAEKLLEEEVRKLRVDVTDAEVDRVVKGTMQEHNLDEQTLKMALARQGMTLEDYRDGLKKQLTKMKIIQLKVKSRVQVTDQDVKSKLAQRSALDAADYRVRARHILVLVPPGTDGAPEQQKILAVKQRLDRGEDFAAVAKEVSEDPGSKDHGGDLGEFGRGEMVPEFERAAYAAEPGKVVGPVRTAFGWHLILVDARVPVAQKSGADVEVAIRERLFGEEVERQFRTYVDELKRDAHIEKRL